MNTTTLSLTATSSISDVERDTGVAKETLRVWERRYDFPRPLRDANGERIYPPEQVQKLRLVKRLLDLGLRPSKVIRYDIAQLRDMAEQAAGQDQARASGGIQPELQSYLALCRRHDMDALRRKLSQSLLVLGLKSFVIDLVAPLTSAVGAAWASGQLAVFEEHLYTETLNNVLRSAIFSMPQAHAHNFGTPRIMLTTLPQERHGLGLLMAEALCAVEGAHCVSLGVQTPLLDIVEAARAQQIDIVALSFSATMNPRQALDGLVELRARLASASELWASGNSLALQRRAPSFVRVYGLEQISDMIAQWRQRHHQRNQPAPAF